MILSSHQPNFVPYMGFFYKAFRSDIFVISDDVCFSKKGMHNWNKIYTQNGVKKITVPINAHHDRKLNEILICSPNYSITKICKTLVQEYRKAPCFHSCSDIIELMLALSEKNSLEMVEFNLAIIEHLLNKFNINVKMLRADEDLKLSGHKDDRIFQMCELTGADTYLSGTGAKAYHDEEEYRKRNIQLVYSDYTPVLYEQPKGSFVENLSVLDYIFNNGYILPKGWCKNE